MAAQQHSTEAPQQWPPCRLACPVHADVRTYIKHISLGRYSEALDVIRQRLPYAAVCGRICHHPCEQNCRRRDVDRELAIRELKRFVAEHPQDSDLPVIPGKQDKARVAIIGGGPSGMSAALGLARLGFRPTIFEREDIAGGIPMLAIPEYRLPRKVLAKDIGWILAHGIELQTGVRIGRERTIKDLHSEGYEAVIIAAGMSRSRILPLPGRDHPRVFGVLGFLKALAAGRNIDVGRDVLVIGGGNVACDAARAAVRLGCDRVRVICLENEEEMPAWASEVAEAKEEGIRVLYRRGPVEIRREEGRISGLLHKKVTEVFDREGRFNPAFDEQDTAVAECDTVVFAIGQTMDPDFIEGSGLSLDERGRIPFDPKTQQTEIAWIFGCGEVVTPPGSIVEACASGLRAAEAVTQYLTAGTIQIDDTLPPPVERIDAGTAGKVSKRDRVQLNVRPGPERRDDYCTYVATLDEREAVAEARRCMECGSGAVITGDQCAKCLNCVRLCPYEAPQLNDRVRISEERCQACGICYSACPANAIRMQSGLPELLAGQIEGMVAELGGKGKPKIVTYVCGRLAPPEQCCGRVNAASENCREIYLANPGMLDSPQILHTLEAGADAVFIVVPGDVLEYHPGSSKWLRRRVARLQDDLEAIGIHSSRIQLFELADHGIGHIREAVGQGLRQLEQGRGHQQ